MSRVEPNRNVYVGHRYVPLLVGEWDKSIQYEGLSIVTFKGNSYTSKKMTPPGIDIENEEYWVVTGNYDAQVEYYRLETERVSDDLAQAKIDLNQRIDDTVEHVNSNVEDLTIYVNDEVRKNREYVYDKVEELTTYVDTELDKKANIIRNSVNVVSPPPPINPAIGDGITDDTNALKYMIDNYEDLIFPSGTYKVTDELTFRHGQSITTTGKVVLDGMDFIGDNGNTVMRVKNTGSDYSTLPLTTGNLSKGEQVLTFSGEHNLNVGDIICLYDNTDYSFSSARPYYKKGEFAKIGTILSSYAVLLDSPLFDDYQVVSNANFGIYKMNMGEFNIYGGIEVKQGKKGNFYAMRLERVKDFKADNIKAQALNGSYTALSINQCYNTNIKITAVQEKLSDIGGDYGVTIANSQHTTLDGYFSASRHGITHGGSDGIGSIVNRDSNIFGVVKTTSENNPYAFDSHGNCEHIKFTGTIYGGASVGGDYITLNGDIYSAPNGVCININSAIGFNFDFNGVNLISKGNPREINRGVIDFGGNTTADNENMKGGVFDISNVNMYAPYSELGLVVRTRNEVFNPDSKLIINANNSHIELINENATAFLVGPISDDRGPIELLNTETTYTNGGYSVSSGVKNLIEPKQKGVHQFDVDSDTDGMRITVNFDKPFARTPVINVDMDNVGLGTFSVGGLRQLSRNGFDYEIRTMNGENFSPTVETSSISWTAQ